MDTRTDYFIYGLLSTAQHAVNHALNVAANGAGKIDNDLWKLHEECSRVVNIWRAKTVDAGKAEHKED